jgi:uncharacterized membrane protein YgcG
LHCPARRRHWIILVWIVIAFFIFPLTPPISQQLPYEDSVSGKIEYSHTYMHLEQAPSKQAVNPARPLYTWVESSFEKGYYLILLILFFIFLRSKVPEQLKKYLLGPIKFTSIYVIDSHSYYTRLLTTIKRMSLEKRELCHEPYCN